jgi:hypothetical protein
VFSIIITACYTGSIIAFVTLPLYPATIDTIQQLFDGFFRIGTFGDFKLTLDWALKISKPILNCIFVYPSFVAILGASSLPITSDHGGWSMWFANSTEPETVRIQQQLEFVTTLEEGVQNITEAFIWPYALLGSENELKYMIQMDFSDE